MPVILPSVSELSPAQTIDVSIQLLRYQLCERPNKSGEMRCQSYEKRSVLQGEGDSKARRANLFRLCELARICTRQTRSSPDWLGFQA